jgi:FkbM family methyltransferase
MIKYLFLKNIKKLFNIFGADIIRRRKTFNQIYKDNLKKNPIIFDIGANEGQSIKRFNYIFPESIIYSFEPIKESFDKIIKLYNKRNFIVNNFALGEKEEKKKFYINKHSFTSSFFKINNKYKELHDFDKAHITANTKVTTLDKYIKLHNIKKIDILKIDTQGYELNILKGAKLALKKKIIKFIELEIIIADYYKKKINLHDIDLIMSKNNYYLYNIENFCYDKNGKLKWFDMLYMNKNL